MHPLIRIGYEGAALAAKGLSNVLPAGGGKLRQALRGRRGIAGRYKGWGELRRGSERPLVWIHAPSVGEGLQARPILELLRRQIPEAQLAYTFFSPSAVPFAELLDVDFRDYLPFDTRGDARMALDALRPSALVFAKLDVWPGLIQEAARRGVRTGLVSATVAPASSRRSPLAALFLREAYGALDRVGAVSAEDAQRLTSLGVRARAISVTGDTRYDQVWARAERCVPASSPLLASFMGGRPTLVAGSTWPSDERVLLPALTAVRSAVPDLRLIIAPHEPTPAHLRSIEHWAAGRELRISRLDAWDAAAADVVLVDRVGVLGDLYAVATVSYVGGAFHAAGLHSVLEPAAFGVPVVVGPLHAQSRDAAALIASGGCASGRDVAGVAAAITHWLVDRNDQRVASQAARRLIRRGLGASDASVALIRDLISIR